MRKSSLGRRSSTQIPVRVSGTGVASGQKSYSGSKQQSSSKLKPPGFTQVRSQSEDRESYGGRPMPSTMLLPNRYRRSQSADRESYEIKRPSTAVRSSYINMVPGKGLSSMTPITPRPTVNSNLPTGSSARRVSRGQTMSIESNRRMSSFGGSKNIRKDSRPINEKPFQQAAQSKVQQYFETYDCDILNSGNSIRPMNTKLFVDMMDFLLKKFDSRIFITKSNYLEELPQLLKKLGYRSKVDRSWLMTVNTPHSWPHVVAVLSWLVEAIQCMEIDGYEMMYTNNMSETEEDDDEDGITINSEVILHLKKTFKYNTDSKQDEAIADAMDDDYVQKEIVDLKCTDEDFEMLQREISLIRADKDSEVERRAQQMEIKEKVQDKRNVLLADCENSERFIEESKTYITDTDMKIKTLEQEIELAKSILEKKQEELKIIEEKISSQQISVDEKEKLAKEKHDLHRIIQLFENRIHEYDKSAFSVDLKCAENQRKLDKLLANYNKLVAEKITVEPRLKDVEMNLTVLSNTENDATMEVVDNNLKSLIDEYKNSIQALNSRQEECENMLRRMQLDKKETEADIDKETALLEGLERDLKKQEELINKDTQKLKDKESHYKKKTKEITDELSQFDSAKLEEKKLELKKLEHDWELLQKKTKQMMEEVVNINREGTSRLAESLKKLSKKSKEFQKNHL